MTQQISASSPIIVQKYGGSSLATAERIRNAARRIAAAHASGAQVIVVVSAMGDTTDELLNLAREVSADPPAREMDLLLSTGETISAALMAMALGALGLRSVALTGGQAGIRTDTIHSRARITDINPQRLRQELGSDAIPIVTGFQGVNDTEDVTTLGRGGSDTSAVALAAAVQADRCEIYTDVEGIYTADPRLVPEARKLEQVSYEEMLELAQLGARVMHPRAVELGELYDMPILVASSFVDAPGTLITRAEHVEVRKNVRGLAHDTDVGKITVTRVPDRPGIAHAIFAPLATAGISVDTIVQNAGLDSHTDISFTVTRGDVALALPLVEQCAAEMHAGGVSSSENLAKVSIVGTGMQSAPGFAARMFGCLSDRGINIEMITTSDIRITCIIERDRVKEALEVLHRAFELDRDA
ncbi:MAG: aspartate kinase [Chloroflexota bacterium]